MNGQHLQAAFDPTTLPDGVWVTAADTEAYPLLKVMQLMGEAKLLGMAFEPSGRQIVTFQVGEAKKPEYKKGREVSHNVRMEISQRWLQNAILDYSDWQMKWWREAVQNSADAKASEIRCYSDKKPDGTWEVGCIDDGNGMTLEILLEKFLVMGGTTKEGGTTSGGFGKAKEMLILPWMSWWIHTRDNLAVGVGDSYSVYKAEGSKWVWHKLKGEGEKPDFEPPKTEARKLDGTQLEVHMPADKHTTVSAAMVYVEKCWLPRINFTFETNDPESQTITNIQGALKNGRTVEEIGDKARIHYTKATTQKPRVLVRTREGLFMFEDYLPHEVQGYVVVELLKPSIQLLSSNRDSISDWELRNALSEFKSNLSRNTQSALAEKKNKIVEVYKGEMFSARQQEQKEAEIVAAIGKLAEGKIGQEEKFEVEDMPKRMVGDILEEEYKRAESEAKPGSIVLNTNKEGGEAMLDIKMTGPNQADAAAKQLVWTPAYILINEINDYRVPSKFRPANMTPAIMRLIKVWTELCKFVLIQLGCSREWGTGYYFTKEARAAYSRRESMEWLVLNPLKEGANKDEISDEIYNPSDETDLKFLYALAIHECTHLADNAHDHEEVFTCCLTKNIALCADGFKKIKKIAGSIHLRGQPEFEAKRKAKEAKKAAREPFAEFGSTESIAEKVMRSMPNSWHPNATAERYAVDGVLKGDSAAIFDDGSVVFWRDPNAHYGGFTAARAYISKWHDRFISYIRKSENPLFVIIVKDEKYLKEVIERTMKLARMDPEESIKIETEGGKILINNRVGEVSSYYKEFEHGTKMPERVISKPHRAQIGAGQTVQVDANVNVDSAKGILFVDHGGVAHTIWADTSVRNTFDYMDAKMYAVDEGIFKSSAGYVEFSIPSGDTDTMYVDILDDVLAEMKPSEDNTYDGILRIMGENPRLARWIYGLSRILEKPDQKELWKVVVFDDGKPKTIWWQSSSEIREAAGSVVAKGKRE